MMMLIAIHGGITVKLSKTLPADRVSPTHASGQAAACPAGIQTAFAAASCSRRFVRAFGVQGRSQIDQIGNNTQAKNVEPRHAFAALTSFVTVWP